MSGYSLQACDEGHKKNKNSMQPNKSIWMDRWMTTSSKHLALDQGEMAGQIAEPSNQKMLDINASPCNISEYQNTWRYQGEDVAVASNLPHSNEEVEVLAEAKRVEITYETLAMNTRNLGGPRLESEPFSMFKFSEKLGRILAQNCSAVSIKHESITQTDGVSEQCNAIEPSNFKFLSEAPRSTPTGTTSQLRQCHSLPGSRSKYQEPLLKPFLSLEKVRLLGSELFQDKVAGSSSSFLPYVFKSREVQSSLCRKEEIDRSSSQLASLEHIKRGSTNVERENGSHRGSSSVLNKQIDSYHLGSRNYDGSSYSWKKDGALQLNDLSSSEFSFASHRKPHKRKDDFTFAEHLPSQNHPGKLRRLEELNCGCHSSSDVPQPVHQNDELRAFSTVDFVEGVLKEPRISQTTNHLSIQDMSNAAPELHHLSESASQKLYTLLPDFDGHKECSEKLQPLGSPRNSENKIGAKDERTASLASKNESSAETDTMDINVCQKWNAFPGITSSASYKDTRVKNSAKSHSTILREALGSRTETELPDVNQEPPPSLSAEKKNIDFSTSRTESLDVEHLHFDQAGKSSSSLHCFTRMPDPSSKWVKRLKPTLPGCQAHGKIEDSSSTAESDKLYNKIPDLNRNNLTPTFDKNFGKSGTPELDRTTLPLKNKHDSMSSSKKSCDINLSHPWIRRWCRNQAPHAQIEGDCSKTASDDYNIKEFPSIAAMALMGKAMNGLQACNFQNKGSFVVWGKGRPPGPL